MLRTCMICCALAGVIGLTVGCNDTKNTASTKPTPTKKDEFVAAYKSDLAKLEKQVDDLKAKAEKATGEEKTKLETKWKESAGKRDAAKKKLEEMEKVAGDKWDAASKDAESAYDDLKNAVKE